MSLCPEKTRSGAPCTLDAGHRGYHSEVDHGHCDACGRKMRSIAAEWGQDGEYEFGLAFCFLCMAEQERRRWKNPGWDEV